jgi:hypothetical protein
MLRKNQGVIEKRASYFDSATLAIAIVLFVTVSTASSVTVSAALTDTGGIA